MSDTSKNTYSSIGEWLVRGFLFVLCALALGQMVLSTRESWMQRPTQGFHADTLRQSDTPTTSTLLIKDIDTLSALDSTWIDFRMLETTELKRQPPPIYTDKMEGLDGEMVQMVGYMTPYNSLKDMREFMIMPNATGCYYCAPPSPTQVALIRQAGNVERPFINEPILVEGRLDLWKTASADPAHKMFLYVIKDATVTGIDPETARAYMKKRKGTYQLINE